MGWSQRAWKSGWCVCLASMRSQGSARRQGDLSPFCLSVLPFLRVGTLVYYTPVVQWLLLGCLHCQGGCLMGNNSLPKQPSCPPRTQPEVVTCIITAAQEKAKCYSSSTLRHTINRKSVAHHHSSAQSSGVRYRYHASVPTILSICRIVMIWRHVQLPMERSFHPQTNHDTALTTPPRCNITPPLEQEHRDVKRTPFFLFFLFSHSSISGERTEHNPPGNTQFANPVQSHSTMSPFGSCAGKGMGLARSRMLPRVHSRNDVRLQNEKATPGWYGVTTAYRRGTGFWREMVWFNT